MTHRNNMTAKERKDAPLYMGVLKYFPDALLEVAKLSKVGNDQHNPGQPLHWAKAKSTDEGDALMRHLLDAGTRDTDGMRHSAKVAWRALALLQREIDAELAQTGPHLYSNGEENAKVEVYHGPIPPKTESAHSAHYYDTGRNRPIEFNPSEVTITVEQAQEIVKKGWPVTDVDGSYKP